jgi:flagellar secretion chaperone FliS
MNPYLAYRQTQLHALPWTRIDLLLALYDKAVERITAAEEALRAGDRPRALPLISKAQLIVLELAAGVRTDVDAATGTDMLRLYEFAAHELAAAGIDNLRSALRVLTTLREGFRTIRDEAVTLERTGRIPAAGELAMLATEA